jgi:two-component sensor histidine kinase/ligand-binding sensor domain-containing protein
LKYIIKYQLKFIAFLVAILSTYASTKAQTYNFKHFSVEEGLSQSQVNCIIQDSRGYLWIGTAGGGICKFDGINFTKYDERNGLAGNIVTGITEDKEGNIWITSTWGGVTKYDGRKFIILTAEDGLLSNNNRTIFSDTSGRVWIGSSSGLSLYSNGNFKNFTKENNKYLGNPIHLISQDSKGNIVLGGNNGITILNKKDTIHLSTKNGLPSNNISAFLEDQDGNYFLATKKTGLLKILKGNLSDSKYSFETIKNTKSLSINSVVQDKDKTIWFSTTNNGLYSIKKDNQINNIRKDNGLKNNSISDLFEDKLGNLWIGTNGVGLIKMGNTAFTYFDKIDGLNNPNVFSIVEDDNNNIWVSTADEGVFRYNGETSVQYTSANGLGNNTVRSSVKDKKGNLWFATENGLTRYKNGVFKNFTVRDGLPINNIRTLLLDSDGNLWVGTYGKGLVKYNYKSFKTYTSEENGLSHNYIHSLYQDSKGNIWIGTGNGINKYNNGVFSNYSQSVGICNPYIGSISEDKYGNIWFGTDRCVVKYDGVDFKSLNVTDGLSSEVVYLLHGSSRGNLWIGTNNGMDKVSFNNYGQINDIKNYGAIEGFKGVECNSRAIHEDKSGNLWIGTVKGVIKYNPSEDREDVFEPSIHINDIRLSFEKVNWFSYSKKLSAWSNLPKTLELDYDENHLTFDFSAINLTYPEYTQYSFKLEGFDKDWYRSTKKTSATYSNLPAGKYTFMVKARNNNHVWNQNPAKFSFTISSPFWKTWWFYIILSVVIFYSIYKISSYREKNQLMISKELEKKIKERTSLIEKQRDEKEILLKEIHHRVKNNMQVIISLLSIQSSYTKDKRALELFDEAKNRIRSMALIHEKMYQTGDLAHIDFQDYIMALTDDLIKTYSINCDIFLDIKIEKVKFDIDTLIPVGLLLNEIISNALKYAFIGVNKGIVTIHLSYDNETNTYSLLVGDNGSGMEKGTLDKDEGSLGMELIKVFVSQLDGTIDRLEKEGTFYQIEFSPRIKQSI